MKIDFIVKYYSQVTDEVIEKHIEADTIAEAWNKAHQETPAGCEESFDVYVDTLMIEEATVYDGNGVYQKI